MEIECKFIASPFGYSCEVSKVSITQPNVGIASFKGNHQPARSNKDVTDVDFRDARVEHLPRNLQRIFPNLKTLRIHRCGLKEIFREDLVGLEKLECLSLSRNQLKSLPDDLLSNMPSLKYVYLSNNKIEFASSKLIEPIVCNQLEHFYLNGNVNINEYYSPVLYDGCKTIQGLMDKIDEKCKPPTPQPISKTAQYGLNRCHAEEIFKEFNEHRLAGRFDEAFKVFLDYLHEQKLPGAQSAMEIYKLAAKYEFAKLKAICEGIIHENLDESNALEIFKLACGPHKSEELKVAAFRKIQEKFCGELDDDLINDPDQLQKIVETKKVLEELMNRS